MINSMINSMFDNYNSFLLDSLNFIHFLTDFYGFSSVFGSFFFRIRGIW